MSRLNSIPVTNQAGYNAFGEFKQNFAPLPNLIQNPSYNKHFTGSSHMPKAVTVDTPNTPVPLYDVRVAQKALKQFQQNEYNKILSNKSANTFLPYSNTNTYASA